MVILRLSQTSRSSGGWEVTVRQKLGTKSMPLIAMISSQIAFTSGLAS